MNKIIADLEDFVLLEKEHNTIKDVETQQKIHNLLLNLIDYVQSYSDNNDIDNVDKVRAKFTQYYNKKCSEMKIIIKKTELILEYQKLLNLNKISKNMLLEKLLCKKPSRSISGISSITLVMSPFPDGQAFSCKHNCYYCPNEPAHSGNNFQAQPRSYLYHEPAVRRANRNKFESYQQMIDRMNN